MSNNDESYFGGGADDDNLIDGDSESDSDVEDDNEEEEEDDNEEEEDEEEDEDEGDGEEEDGEGEGGGQSGGGPDDDDIDEQVVDEEERVTKSGKKIKKIPAKKIVKKAFSDEMSDDDDEDHDDDGEMYLKKFDREVNENYIVNNHPECMMQNYDEILAMTTVVRDENNIIIDDLHMTNPFLTKYERARILGQRAKQIETGATPFVKVPENIIDSYLIAEMELQQVRIPFIIRRPLPNGGSEYWKISDLENIAF